MVEGLEIANTSGLQRRVNSWIVARGHAPPKKLGCRSQLHRDKSVELPFFRGFIDGQKYIYTAIFEGIGSQKFQRCFKGSARSTVRGIAENVLTRECLLSTERSFRLLGNKGRAATVSYRWKME